MKTKLFDLEYVHECWDDEIDCRGYFNERSRKLVEVQAVNTSLGSLIRSIEKLAYMGVDITAPTEISNHIPSIEVLYNNDDDFQFRTQEGGLIRYVYYDPNLAAKVAYLNGAAIEYYDDEDKGWHTASQLLWDDGILQWDDGTLYRIKSEDEPEPELQWHDLTIGDVITKGLGIFKMVTTIDINDVSSHIYAMGHWISDDELKKYHKVNINELTNELKELHNELKELHKVED